MTWRDHRDDEAAVFVNDRHRALHYGAFARGIAGQLPRRDAVVLDHGCGEALSADRVAAHCAKLYLCDGAAPVRARLAARFEAEPKIAVLAPDDVEALPDHGLDLVVASSLLHHLPVEELDELLGLWHSKLKEDGRLVLADVIPHESRPREDAAALLRFAWSGGFFCAALLGLSRGAFADDAKPRGEFGSAQYSEEEMVALLRDRSFTGRRADRNLGHDQNRMTFLAQPI